MSKATLIVSIPLLLEALHLPEGTEIHAANMDFFDMQFDRVSFLVSHQEILEGTSTVTPELVYHFDEDGNQTGIDFVGWNSRT